MPASKRAKEIIEKIIYITIASVSKDGQPWNTPVYCTYDKNYNFYWVSWKENQHSKNIKRNPNVFLVIYDSTVPEGTGEGVYIRAKATELSDISEIEPACQYLYNRKNKTPKSPEEFLGNSPRRVYKAVPEKVWINNTGKEDGKSIDTRVEVQL